MSVSCFICKFAVAGSFCIFFGYSYCINNPLKYTNPSGQIFGLIGGLIRGTINIFVKGDILAPVKEGLHGLGLDIKLLGGLFQGNFTQILSRNTWESLQTAVGFLYSEYNLLTHDIEAIEYYDGATYVLNKNRDYNNGISIGSYININDKGDLPYDENGNFAPYKNIMYMHEYGHYIQSQGYGFGYLFNIGIPSLLSLSPFGDGKEMYIGNVPKHRYKWFERSANKKAVKYFEGLYDKWDYINYPIKK